MSWYDGCNWRGTPLLSLLLVFGLTAGGLALLVGPTIWDRVRGTGGESNEKSDSNELR